MESPYDSRIVANTFLSIAAKQGLSLTNMHVQKLVYFAHGLYLAEFGTPLIEETVQAWQYGPVIPGLYNEFKDFGGQPIRRFYKEVDPFDDEVVVPTVNKSDHKFLSEVFEQLKGYSAQRLSQMSHAVGSPWTSVYRADQPFVAIPLEAIRDYFKQLASSDKN